MLDFFVKKQKVLCNFFGNPQSILYSELNKDHYLSFCCIENNLLLHEMQSVSRLIPEVILIKLLENTNTFSNCFSEL